MAQNGLLGTGYAESSKVSMYNAYQNRVATARESYNRAVIEYDNAIKDAQLANNATLAELAHNTLQTKLELAFQSRLAAQNETEDRYYNRWKDVLSQINTEKAFEYQKERDRIADEQYAQSLAARYSGGGGGITYTDGGYEDTGSSGSTWYQRAANKVLSTVNGQKKNSDTISAVMTPSLSKKSYNWYNQNFSKSMTINQINQAIARGQSDGYLTDSDVDRIYKAYQLK